LPTGHGPRFALAHAGNEKGFVPNAKFLFLCKKQLLTNLPPESIIVLGSAAYHSRRKEMLLSKS
jgi:hypothetical protein